MSVLAITAVALSLASSVAAQRRTSRTRRIAGGAIAGIVIGCVVLGLLFCLCCCMLFRRRRARNNIGPGQPAPGLFGGGGRFGGGRFGGLGGAGKQAGWNTNAAPAYQPPAGAPPSAPQPGGFMAVSVPSPGTHEALLGGGLTPYDEHTRPSCTRCIVEVKSVERTLRTRTRTALRHVYLYRT
ncbi:hypothetical protein C8T65DRAFT_639874 [Cerioporus squamosus]|nr:hypothetical protein C8T65DRAFT_639874 [Cerioporus squamosus]